MSTVRFAPSPTGMLHVGNARVALINWLYARKHGGDFILRLDDTDSVRSRQEYADGIVRDLTWLGVTWTRVVRQSARLDRYRDAFDRLHEAKRVYACYETPQELSLMRKRLLSRGRPPVYDRAGLSLSGDERAHMEAQGRRPHWRFLLSDDGVSWDDQVHGTVRFDKLTLSDPVLYRSDGRPLFTLPSVVDDIEMDISLVVRGDDHITNTAVQIDLFRALGGTPPDFAHVPLLRDSAGGDLSKRDTTRLSLHSLADEGIEAPALGFYLTGLGASFPEPEGTAGSDVCLDRRVEAFDFSLFSKSSAKFNREELARYNRRVLHDMSLSQVTKRLARMGLTDIDEAFWHAIRPNLDRLSDAQLWWRVCYGAVTVTVDEPDYLAQALAVLPPEPWDETTWKTWMSAVKTRTGRKGKELFLPLRLALTGVGHGPALDDLLPVIGRDRVHTRLCGQIDGDQIGSET